MNHRAILVVPTLGQSRIVHLGDARGAGFGIVGSRAVLGRVREASGVDGVRRRVERRRPSVATWLGGVRHLVRAAWVASGRRVSTSG